MSDRSDQPPGLPRGHCGHGNHWSIRKIVEDVTGKKIEEFQDNREATVKVDRRAARRVEEELPRVEDDAGPSEPLTSFLPQPKRAPLFSTLPPELLENVPFPPGGDSNRKSSNGKQLERLYLAYLMLHMGGLTDPALRYLRDAVEDECRGRGLLE